MIDQEIMDWMLLLGRWVHITVAVSWIGTSVFFMWMDRTFVQNPETNREGHIGDLWMVHGGGFYKVEKMLMGPTKVPSILHWFKWESYWTWMSGMFLLVLTYYTGSGTYLLDASLSDISFTNALLLSLFSIFGSFIFYDFIWERDFTKTNPIIGHILTIAWFIGMTYILCQHLSGRAAYIHIGAMLGTWMAGNVFLRIIPRQVKMVEATERGEKVNPDWGKNAKNRSTHNTYFTLPVIFIMISNHFPATYGHEANWIVLILITLAGALIREYFIIRLFQKSRAQLLATLGIFFLLFTIWFTKTPSAPMEDHSNSPHHHEHNYHKDHNEDQNDHEMDEVETETIKEFRETKVDTSNNVDSDYNSPDFDKLGTLSGVITLKGTPPKGKKLRLPGGCAKAHKGDVYSDEVVVNNGKLANVLVRITKGIEGLEFPEVPDEEVVLDQIGCVYVPKMIAARVGQKVTFVNSDKLFHNVKSVSKENKGFNLLMPQYKQRKSQVFKKPELFMQTKCSVHPWMKAYIAILDHPFFAVTKEDGAFKISEIPEGKYTLEIWHEVYGTQTKEFEITKDTNTELNFTFNAK